MGIGGHPLADGIEFNLGGPAKIKNRFQPGAGIVVPSGA